MTDGGKEGSGGLVVGDYLEVATEDLRLMSVISAVRQSLEESCGGRVGHGMVDEH